MRFLFLITVFISPGLYAGQITGQIRDFATGKYLQGAEVFLDKSMNKAVSDESGYFVIEDIQPGKFTVGCFKHGYEAGITTLTVKEGDNITLFILKKDRRKKIKNPEAQQEIIKRLLAPGKLFPEWNSLCVLKTASLVQYDNDEGTIAGKLVFENKALGYEITVHVLDYSPGKLTVIHQFYPLRGSEDRQNQWETNRYTRYQLSVNNFLEAILQNTSDLYDYKVYNHQNTHIPLNHFLHIGLSGESNKLELEQRIKIIQTYNDKLFESWLEATGQLNFSDHGLILNPDEVTLGGIFSETSLSVMLPLEYTPAIEKKYFKLSPYFEKVYLHTDKPYYYPGDTLWFKAYLNYADLMYIESLSKVLYVELFDQTFGGRMVEQKKLKISDGEAWGEFVLPDSLTSSWIALRAYTQWQLNFGTEQVFKKYFPLVNRKVNLMNTRHDLETNPNTQVLLDKQRYNTRDKIKMGISVFDENKNPISAWLSVSVTDRSMVRLLDDSVTVNTAFEIKPFDEPGRVKLAIEKGIGIQGLFVDEKNSPTMASLTLTSGQFSNAFMFETDQEGEFSIGGLDFSGMATVAYRAQRGKMTIPGNVILQSPEPLPPFKSWPPEIKNVERADFKIDKNTTLLEEVIIHAKQVTNEQSASKKTEKEIIRILGNPNYTLTADRLNQSAHNVIEMIRGRVPGLTITFDGINYGFRFNRSTSMVLSNEPAVFIDDTPMAGSAQMALLSINPGDVAVIEIMSSLNAIAGSLGANGIIAVYTKASGLRGKFETNPEFQSFTVTGFSVPSEFTGINHSKMFIPPQSDFRTTLYWKPDVVASATYGPAWLEFYASDSTGPYLVTIEGVTKEGKPVRAERLILLKEKENE